ncbi:hypothetical protein [Desulfonema magnum]|uniref:Uncharacterized protein n=1 Tax=Desulfonema magnum TaxID=45655 RepID=A0A975BID4_9BACT|nr:hypothetical protein [Desulfonema magnum]QTA85878.1 Uncharacterized protein dnm_018940 [Desulfonema magnum]
MKEQLQKHFGKDGCEIIEVPGGFLVTVWQPGKRWKTSEEDESECFMLRLTETFYPNTVFIPTPMNKTKSES